MKKQKVQLLVMLVVLLVGIGAYFGVEKYIAHVDNKVAEEELQSKIYITQFDPETIESLSFEYSGERYFFVKEEGVWVYEEDKSLEIEQDKIRDMAEAFANLTAENKLEGVTDLAQYGLTEPSRTLSFTTGGMEYVWYIGNMNNVTYVYYMYQASDIGTVYTVTSSFLSKFNHDLEDLVVVEETGETEAETTETVEIETVASETESTETVE